MIMEMNGRGSYLQKQGAVDFGPWMVVCQLLLQINSTLFSADRMTDFVVP